MLFRICLFAVEYEVEVSRTGVFARLGDFLSFDLTFRLPDNIRPAWFLRQEGPLSEGNALVIRAGRTQAVFELGRWLVPGLKRSLA
ncbi:hypothetical protein [Magnetospirillum fulvum]|uniref:Uncharacterized protein n=1 Tax=Magnetospirillum fulvum MGU-K5 TaxID=1316936 RepID=S9TH89_MAGFU|nr:hypothetical protein [Magnetospirillum fulvum]EPY01626.1 hypothetical protein K678_09938 [Magnetospirillum fulvum MGU-K5]